MNAATGAELLGMVLAIGGLVFIAVWGAVVNRHENDREHYDRESTARLKRELRGHVEEVEQ